MPASLRSVNVVGLGDTLGRRAGILLGRSGLTDPVDAAVAAMADDRDTIVTSDPVDLARLVMAAERDVTVVGV